MPYRLHEPYSFLSADECAEYGITPGSNYDPERKCPHTPDQTYTREPCSCGRELWPPRGRGRGESLLSPRRIEAKLKAVDALALHIQGWPYRAIAAKLAYKTTSGAWQAVQRIRDHEAEWARWESRTGRRLYHRHQPTPSEIGRAIAHIEEELLTGGLDGRRLEAARERLRRTLVEHGR
jgi:hypothetical protein